MEKIIKQDFDFDLDEATLEDKYLGCFAIKSRAINARKIGRLLGKKGFCANNAIPERFTEIDVFLEDFWQWIIQKDKAQDLDKEDCRLHIAFKIWQNKKDNNYLVSLKAQMQDLFNQIEPLTEMFKSGSRQKKIANQLVECSLQLEAQKDKLPSEIIPGFLESIQAIRTYALEAERKINDCVDSLYRTENLISDYLLKGE